VSPANVSLAPGGTIQLTSALDDDTGHPGGVTFSSSEPCVASVSATGLVTAWSPGSARITVASQRDASFTTTATVIVQRTGPVRLTIQSVTFANAEGQQVPVDPANVSGVVTVTINAGERDPAYSLVELLVGGRIVASRVPSIGTGDFGVAIFVVNTAERDANGARRFPDGATLLQARAHRPAVAGAPGCAGGAPTIDQIETGLTVNNGGT
jgi:hypothetical protein